MWQAGGVRARAAVTVRPGNLRPFRAGGNGRKPTEGLDDPFTYP